jgi:hypothetical protein
MSLPIQEIPHRFKALLSWYKKCFTKPQYKNFRDFVLGLIVSDKKTVQEINDCFGRVDQSSLNRFLTCSDWNPEKVNNKRISQIKSHHTLRKGVLICDPTFLQKFGKKMQYANYHYNGMTKKEDWGYFLVNSFFTDGNTHFPVCADFYLRKEDADANHPFKSVREICLAQLDYAMKRLPVWLFIADAGLYADFLIQDIRSRGLKYILGTRVTNNISINGKKRVSIEEYLQTLTDDDFKIHMVDGEAYFLHMIEVSERNVGREKLLISYKEGNEEELRINVTNLMRHSDRSLLCLLSKRWNNEVWHRDGKQHLGLEDYQVRKFGAMQRVVCAILVAYTQLILMREERLLKPFHRILETIGEGCRYVRLIALKGIRWLKKKAQNLKEFKKILNEQVFVKNAKV